MFGTRSRLRILLVALVLLALASNIHWLRAWLIRRPVKIDQMAPFDARLSVLRDALPTRGTVRYISDQPSLGFEQYALVPLIVVGDGLYGSGPAPGDDDFLVLDYHHAENFPKIPPGYRVVKDGGDGVMLLQRSR